jgi:pilus assembly protein CpaF
MGFEVILPFLYPIEALIQDGAVSEIMVNGSTRVFIERCRIVEEVSGVTIPERSLQFAVRNIARALGDETYEEKPMLDSRLPDGSRVAAVIPPCSVNGTTLTIRKFHSRFFTPHELVRAGTLTPPVLDALHNAIERQENILISGGTARGKTTLMTALATFIPGRDRIILIEDTSEVQLVQPNLVRFEARREQPGIPPVTIRDLLRATLRHRPDRIILGEVRGGEAFDLLQAWNTDDSGGLSTIHANSASQAISRFSSYVLQSGVELPYQVIHANIGDVVHLVLQLERRDGRRYAFELLGLVRFDPLTDRYQFEELYRAEGSHGPLLS